MIGVGLKKSGSHTITKITSKYSTNFSPVTFKQTVTFTR